MGDEVTDTGWGQQAEGNQGRARSPYDVLFSSPDATAVCGAKQKSPGNVSDRALHQAAGAEND